MSSHRANNKMMSSSGGVEGHRGENQNLSHGRSKRVQAKEIKSSVKEVGATARINLHQARQIAHTGKQIFQIFTHFLPALIGGFK